MGKRSLFYRWANIYKAGLKLIPGKKFDEKYHYIVNEIGKADSILEPACGPALIPNYLKNGCKYKGFDINERFIKHAQKKGIDVWVGNALNPETYLESDVVVLCDAIHHIGISHEKQVVEYSLNSAKHKLIICEPFKDNYISMFPNLIPGGKKFLEWWFNYIEKDGSNKVKLDDFKSKKELKEMMMEGYGIIPKVTKKDFCEIGENIIVSYHL